MQNLLKMQEPEGAYNTDLHELQKYCHLKYHMAGTNRKTTLSKYFKQTHFMRYQYIPN